MAHPYSGSAGYIHANEYPFTPIQERFSSGLRSQASTDSLYRRNTTWSADSHTLAWTGTHTQSGTTHTQSSSSDVDAPPGPRHPPKTTTKVTLVPTSAKRSVPTRNGLHPYAHQGLKSWIDTDEDDERDVREQVVRGAGNQNDASALGHQARIATTGPRTKKGGRVPWRSLGIPSAAAAPPRRPVAVQTPDDRWPIGVPYDPRTPDLEKEEEKRLVRRAASWKRKVQRRVKKALRRLRRLLYPNRTFDTPISETTR